MVSQCPLCGGTIASECSCGGLENLVAELGRVLVENRGLRNENKKLKDRLRQWRAAYKIDLEGER